jgi:hypothetical protein
VSRLISTCYISAPPGANLTDLHDSLMQRGIRVVVPQDISFGSDWSEKIRSEISRADLVIGVLTNERRSQWVLFELGQAYAMGRQILLIAPPKIGAIPSSLSRFLVLRVHLKNRSAIDFALDQLLASPSPGVQRAAKRKTAHGLGAKASDLLNDLDTALSDNDYRGLERIVVEALQSSGAEVVAEAPNPELRADLAIWSDALQPFVGNPLLIEIKARIRNSKEAREIAQQLAAATTAAGTGWGLLLYGEGPPLQTLPYKSLPPTILVHSLSSLIEQLRRRSFVEVVRDLRNRRVHGGDS